MPNERWQVESPWIVNALRKKTMRSFVISYQTHIYTHCPAYRLVILSHRLYTHVMDTYMHSTCHTQHTCTTHTCACKTRAHVYISDTHAHVLTFSKLSVLHQEASPQHAAWLTRPCVTSLGPSCFCGTMPFVLLHESFHAFERICWRNQNPIRGLYVWHGFYRQLTSSMSPFWSHPSQNAWILFSSL